jgi:hypothetical protein
MDGVCSGLSKVWQLQLSGLDSPPKLAIRKPRLTLGY